MYTVASMQYIILGGPPARLPGRPAGVAWFAARGVRGLSGDNVQYDGIF